MGQRPRGASACRRRGTPCLLDTNVLVYSTAAADPKAAIAARLLLSGGLISARVLNEFARVARDKLKWSWPEIREALADFSSLCRYPLPPRVATHEAAVAIAERDGLAFYDALSVASALEGGCATSWTEDMQDGRVIEGRLMIRNPFRVG